MTIADLVDLELAHLAHLLEAVPFAPRTDTKSFFLEIYKLNYNEMKGLNLTEAVWEQRHPVPANKLLKLAISFGNLIRLLQMEQAAEELQSANIKRRPGPQNTDPFGEGYDSKAALPFAPHYVKFARNLFHILKNFDIGAPQTPRTVRNSRGSLGENDTTLANGSSTLSGPMSSPIKLNSRQLLIEKLEINIKLDTLFTFKIVLRLLVRIFGIIHELLGGYSCEEPSDTTTLQGDESSLIFSHISNTSGPVPESIHTAEDYVRLLRQITNRVNHGLVDPFTKMLLTEIVEPKVQIGFQGLLSSI